MADPSPRKPVSLAHSSQLISYGHFGTPVYDNILRRWSFLRQAPASRVVKGQQHDEEFTVKLIREAQPVCPIPIHPDASDNLSPKTWSRAFLRNLPELASAVAQSDDDFRPDQSSNDCKSTQSNLLEFGSARVMGGENQQSGLQIVPLIAYVKPAHPDTLLLSLLDQETTAVDQNGQQRIRLPHVDQAQSITWNSRNGTIARLRFSSRASSQGATWLAVCQTTATAVFQPLLHRSITVVSGKAPLDPNLIIQLPISHTGGVQHADVAFHPQDPHLLAIIDIAGNWSIWRISGYRSRSARILRRARLVISGFHSPQPMPLGQTDGWHRIIWLCRKDTTVDGFVIANRHSVALFNLDGLLLDLQNVQIGTNRGDQILDVVPAATHTIFVLTSRYIFTITVSTALMDKAKSHGTGQIMILAIQHHFRGVNDDGLKLHSLFFGSRHFLFLHSAMLQLITVFGSVLPSTVGHTPHQVWDPFFLEMPSSDTASLDCIQLNSIAVEWIDSKSDSDRLHFFKMFFQDTNKNVYEALYQIESNKKLAVNQTDSVPLPNGRHKSVYRIFAKGFDEDLDDFIVSDHDDDGEELGETQSGSSMSSASDDEALPLDIIHGVRLCDLSRIYDLSVVTDYLTEDRIRDKVQDLLAIAEDITSGVLHIFDAPKLMSELPVDNLHISDIERESVDLGNWLLQFTDDESDAELMQNRASSILRVVNTGSVVGIYDQLFDLWVAPLATNMPDRFRVSRERNLRRFALELYLSTILIRPPSSHQTQQYEYAELNTKPESGLLTQTSDHFSEPQLPDLRSSSPSKPSATPGPSNLLLASYIKIKQPELKPGQALTITNDILAHLPTSHITHPNAYDFAATELSLSLARNEFLNSSLDAKSKRKADKLARARQRQLEKQAQSKKVAFESTTALPSVMSSQLPIRGVQSSQAALPSSSQTGFGSGGVAGISMTQPERGVFGTREAKAKVKGKGRTGRKKGF